MSIPPLVCSTPPPPDQCEDDKDPEDFDLSYSLSQEDEDDENNDYNYGNFSSYNHFQSTSDNKPLETKPPEITQNIVNDVHKEIFIEYEISKETEQCNSSDGVLVTNSLSENKLKCEEDMNIEDLNLKVDDEIVTDIEDTSQQESNDQNVDSIKALNIPSNSNSSKNNTNVSSYENVVVPEVIKESHIDLDKPITDKSSDIKVIHEIEVDDADLKSIKEKATGMPIELLEPSKPEHTLEDLETISQEFQESPKDNLDILANKKEIDDDFGDFDDFQFVNNVNSVVECSNPWENANTNETEFGNFTANFEENKFQVQDKSSLENRPGCNSDQIENQLKQNERNLEDDDFGDFDEFKSSTIKSDSFDIQEDDPCQELPVLNLQSSDNEHQIMESITKVITSVFLEEITEPEIEFQGKLELLLSETWGHLMEIDERQPYIVNWNNSLGQKTLLKALCIDSRNILFGPKWSSHMPKYAANLSNAPLQPQKQASAPPNASEVVADKTPSKPTTWSDPFTSDGQEFTYAEALLLDLEHLMATLDQMAHNHSTLKISELLSNACKTENETSITTPRPTDLDVFESAISTKSEKIYSTTLSVQPIRQISLPDTHIFTPTDSEIPRSKTIHYDRSPTGLLPQPAVTSSKNVPEDLVSQNISSVSSVDQTNTEGDSEYWEFQDFKTSDPTGSVSQPQIPKAKNLETATTIDALPKPNIAYQTQLLQPIKVEPSMPTLNWPDPGEVKGEYDDFSDFVSITSQSIEKQDSVSSNTQSQIESNDIIKSDNLNDLYEKTDDVSTVQPDTESFDDDFDTFQSALPSKSALSDFKSSSFGNTDNQTPVSQFTHFDYTHSESNNIKSDSISFATMQKPNEALTSNIGYISNTTEIPDKSSSSGAQTQSNVLQPTPANYNAGNTQNQRTTDQILQPLSLESYSQINWPSPGIDLQDLSRFNPVETLQSLKSDLSVGGLSKVASPVHMQKNIVTSQVSDDDVWGEFVSSKPKQQQLQPKKLPVFVEDDEWTDFISSPSVKPQNGLNTISLNVHTNSNIQKTAQNKFFMKSNQTPVDIPTLNYITPKTNAHKSYNDKHFQNL